MHRETPHDSAAAQVRGAAPYTDDIPEPKGTLHAALGLSPVAHGRIEALDLDAVGAAPGVVAVLTAEDIPGVNDISPVGLHDDPVFATGTVSYHGQPLFAVIAETRDQARRAARLGKPQIAPLPHITAATEAAPGDYVTEPLTLSRGDAAAGLARAPRRLSGRMVVGGQEHFYLEGQIALAIPAEHGGMTVHSSTQHPTEAQHMVAHVLGVPSNAVVVQVRRMGGGFGGKETQMNLTACVAALGAARTGRAVKLRLDRDDDFSITGKRHDVVTDYAVGFDDDGRILAVEADLTARCGFSADLSGPVTDRALFHADNAYFYPDVRLSSHPMRTNTVSNTAFRGFGGPQGLLLAERIIEEIAFATGRDPLDVRRANLYAEGQLTPYHQPVEDVPLPRILDDLEASSGYRARRAEIEAFNAAGGTVRRGIALTPVKFGISFTATWYNQAGALVHVYSDGSILLNHGGTEMGQGLNTKVAQVVASAFAVPLAQVRISATATDKVPNTSATAASSGTDLNGMAALDACEQIKARLTAFACAARDLSPDQVRFTEEGVVLGPETMPFGEFVQTAYLARVQLSAAGFYKTPGIHWDRKTGRGQPFYYFACGAAVTEVEVDTLTGEHRILRTDILHDVGASLNPAIDRGQVEGGFVQGAGWLTSEELWWDAEGRLRTHAPSTYKIPLASDRPRDLRLALVDFAPNARPTIGRSKAVGEPPLMLAASVVEALSMAVASCGPPGVCPRLETPCTPERILMACRKAAGL